MSEDSRVPFHQQHKLPLQGLAFGVMMFLPIGLYFSARAGLDVTVMALLVALGVGMLLAAWVG